MLSVAAFVERMHALAFPSFGSERTGAPVVSFCRIDDTRIRGHEPIAHPDALIVQDATLLHQVDVFDGLGDGGRVLINSSRSAAELGLEDVAARLDRGGLLTVPATDIARAHLGRPLPNAVLLGAFAAFTGVLSIDSVATAITRRFSGPVGAGNVAGAQAAAEYVQERMGGGVVA
jgi:pyruvate ferredoxin oxidoreductase gamma subunit